MIAIKRDEQGWYFTNKENIAGPFTYLDEANHQEVANQLGTSQKDVYEAKLRIESYFIQAKSFGEAFKRRRQHNRLEKPESNHIILKINQRNTPSNRLSRRPSVRGRSTPLRRKLENGVWS